MCLHVNVWNACIKDIYQCSIWSHSGFSQKEQSYERSLTTICHCLWGCYWSVIMQFPTISGNKLIQGI